MTVFYIVIAFVWGVCVGALLVSYMVRRDLRRKR